MSAGFASTSDARKRLAERQAVRVQEPAQGDVIAWRVVLDVLARELPLDSTGHVAACGIDDGDCSCSDLTRRVHDGLAAAGLLASRPEHEVKAEGAAEALRALADDIDPDGYGWRSVVDADRFRQRIRERAARVESEAGERP